MNIRTIQATFVCEHGFADHVLTWQQLLEAVNRTEPRLTVLGTVKHVFPGGGLTGLVMIAESHVAVHTWPEEGMAWVELATCGPEEAIPSFVEKLNHAGWRQR